MNKILYLFFIWLTLQTCYSQKVIDDRLETIKNNIELLKIEVPGLNEKLNVNISNTTLANFLIAVAKIHQININVDPQLQNRNIVNGFTDVEIGDLIIFLVKEYQLDIDFTGNILAIKPYNKPVEKVKEKELAVYYDINNNSLSLDLNENALDKVFRKIMSESGKNLLYSPSLNYKKISSYLQNVPFETALEKLSIANGLELEKTEDGFYIFNDLYQPSNNSANNRNNGFPQNSRRIRNNRTKAAFNYQILDKEKSLISIDVKDTNIADIIYTLVDELELEIFLASPLDNLGTTTYKSNKTSFEELLNDLLDGLKTSGNDPNGNTNSFGYKREKNMYFFGTSNQLSINSIQFVPLQYRSVELLGDASLTSASNTSRLSNGFVNGGGINFIGNNSNGINNNTFSGSQNGALNSNFNSNFNNTRNSLDSSGQNFNNGANTSSTQNIGAITALFPDKILQGLDVKIDVELNGFIVSGPSSKLEKFKNFIHYIDKPIPVILLEVMILEVNKSETLEAGLQIGVGQEATVSSGRAFPGADGRVSGRDFDRITGNSDFQKIIGGFEGFSSLNLGRLGSRFFLDLKAEESNGNVKILSTPKLSTLNGHKAYLSSGQTTYFEVTNQNFFGSQIPQTSEVTNFQPIDAELALEFKPFVAGNGQITLDIQVIQSSFGGRIDESAPPDINSRRFSSIIRMKENDIAILGGLEEKFKNDSGSGVPFLAKIPVIKWLFSNRSRTKRKSKLNILIKPTVFY